MAAKFRQVRICRSVESPGVAERTVGERTRGGFCEKAGTRLPAAAADAVAVANLFDL